MTLIDFDFFFFKSESKSQISLMHVLIWIRMLYDVCCCTLSLTVSLDLQGSNLSSDYRKWQCYILISIIITKDLNGAAKIELQIY